MIAKLLLQNLLYVAGMGALLFAFAGTLHWQAAWIFLGTMIVLGVASGSWLARRDPALLAERMKPMMQEGQPAADKKFMLMFGTAALSWLIVIGLDRRWHGSVMQVAWQALGLALLLLSTGFILWVMRENSFAAPVVKVQAERGHRVIDSGPYAWMRHPMYTGVLLFFIGTPLMLGSWWGVAMAPLFFLLFAVRAGIEERALTEGLPGYADYVARVRYRLVPGVW
jgi:protein-S-isoprenylcysteine O-methyltransferase Ste14